MKYLYKIRSFRPYHSWIYIGEVNGSDLWEEEPFVHFIYCLQAMYNGEIKDIGEGRYKITGDPNHFVYQWDDLFGIVIETQKKADPEGIKALVQSLIDKVNEM